MVLFHEPRWIPARNRSEGIRIDRLSELQPGDIGKRKSRPPTPESGISMLFGDCSKVRCSGAGESRLPLGEVNKAGRGSERSPSPSLDFVEPMFLRQGVVKNFPLP